MKDGIVLTDGEEQVTVNLRSYCELIKWLIVAYAGVSYDEASACVDRHRDYFERVGRAALAASLESHSWPYYYLAMDFYFGDHRRAVSVKPPPEGQEGRKLYMEIENRILREHGLRELFD